MKQIIIFILMAMYLYSLAFGIFITNVFRLPAPLILGIPLLFFFKEDVKSFAYFKEMALFVVALFMYYVLGERDYKTFAIETIIITICALYFNYFVGQNKRRYITSIIVFFSFLLASMIIMVFDHSFPFVVDPLRSMLLGDTVKQSPAGLAFTQFTFGYQIAAFTVFVFAITCAFKQHFLIKALVFGACLTFVYLGMNRSAFVSFAVATTLFMLIYYRFKAVIMIAATVLIGFGVYNYVLKDNVDERNNILAKNEADAHDYNRANLMLENLKIDADYPFGLIFYGKTWDEVTYRHALFAFGLSSHNAYLMFLTYLGPFIGIWFLYAFYKKIFQLFKRTMLHPRLPANALLLCLLFGLFSVSLNALSHNAWLLSADGPTLFLYFCILHATVIQQSPEAEEAENEPVTEELDIA